MYPCLWNRNHVDFKSRPQREQAELALLPISGLSSVRELRQKIRNIRCTYNQELAKIRRSINAGSSEVYKPKLAWFAQADSFLRVNHLECYEDSVKMETGYLQQPVLNGNYQCMKQEMAMEYSASDQESIESTSRKVKSSDQESTYSSHIKNYGSLAEFAETVETHSPVSNSNQSISMNEFVIFGQHVATQLQQLPLEEAIRLEEEIQSIITRARLRSMQGD